MILINTFQTIVNLVKFFVRRRLVNLGNFQAAFLRMLCIYRNNMEQNVEKRGRKRVEEQREELWCVDLERLIFPSTRYTRGGGRRGGAFFPRPKISLLGLFFKGIVCLKRTFRKEIKCSGDTVILHEIVRDTS